MRCRSGETYRAAAAAACWAISRLAYLRSSRLCPTVAASRAMARLLLYSPSSLLWRCGDRGCCRRRCLEAAAASLAIDRGDISDRRGELARRFREVNAAAAASRAMSRPGESCPRNDRFCSRCCRELYAALAASRANSCRRRLLLCGLRDDLRRGDDDAEEGFRFVLDCPDGSIISMTASKVPLLLCLVMLCCC